MHNSKQSAKNLPVKSSINPLGRASLRVIINSKEQEYKSKNDSDINKELLTKANAILYVMMNKGSRKEIVDIAKHIRNKAIDESNKPIIPDIDLILINYGQINQIKEPIKPDDNQGVIDVTSEKV